VGIPHYTSIVQNWQYKCSESLVFGWSITKVHVTTYSNKFNVQVAFDEMYETCMFQDSFALTMTPRYLADNTDWRRWLMTRLMTGH